MKKLFPGALEKVAIMASGVRMGQGQRSRRQSCGERPPRLGPQTIQSEGVCKVWRHIRRDGEASRRHVLGAVGPHSIASNISYGNGRSKKLF